MNRPASTAFAAATLVALVLAGIPEPVLGLQEPPAPAPAPKDPAPPAPQDPPPAGPALPATGAPSGMVRFPGGKVKIGMSRKALDELIKRTELGRKSNQAGAIEDEYSICTPEFEVVLPPFWIGKYEVTNAQWQRFLETPEVRVDYAVPAKGTAGANTLEQISRMHLLAAPFPKAGGGTYYPVANDWKALYELNEAVINPVVEGQDPKTRAAAEAFKDRPLPPGTKIRCYRWSVPLTWRAKPGAKLQAAPPPWMEEMPVTTVSWADASAFAAYYGCHLPTEFEWEAACRGPKGEFWPEGGNDLDPLAHAWKGFNIELMKAQESAKKEMVAALKKVADAKSPPARAEAEAERDRLDWILKAREIPEDPPFTLVGNFPLGRSPCGAMDMIGNVQEWVSNTLFRYPGTDSKSKWADVQAHVLRGGNMFYSDSLLTATFRSVVFTDLALMSHMKFATAGFRVARYEAPGASSATHGLPALRNSNPPILPREEERGTHRLIGPDLDPYRAAGIGRYNEAPWLPTQHPKNDPPGKAFYLARSQGLCILPVTGIPFRDVAAIRNAADKNVVPGAGAGVSGSRDKRDPRDIPLFGLLHLGHGVEVKGDMRVEKVVEVALTDKEKKEHFDRWKEEQKKKEQKAKEEPPKEDPPKEDPPKDGGKDPAPPKIEQTMEGKPGNKGGGGKGGKGGAAPGKPGDPPPDPNAPPDGDKPDEPDDKPEEYVPPPPRQVKVIKHEKGFLKGKDHPDGLLLGYVKIGEENRAALWESRIGTEGKAAPGGTVLLETPLLVLPKDALDFKKVGRPGNASSTLEPTEGKVTLTFYVPSEGKDTSSWFEVTLRLQVEYPTGWQGGPWITMPGK